MRIAKVAAVPIVLAGMLLGGAGAAGPPTLEKPLIQTGPGSVSGSLPGWTQQAGGTFTFVNQDPNPSVTSQCGLDGESWAVCSSPYELAAPLPDGEHSFLVRVITGDPANPTERSTPAEWHWTVDSTPPSLPGNETAQATSPAGAVVSFFALDNLDPSPQFACDPASGTLFPFGQTNVSCTATDHAGNQAQGTLQVSVIDTTPPVLAPHIDVPATTQTAPGGAVVEFTYAADAVIDAGDPNPTVTCSPASGSLFEFGTTIVTCTATDKWGNVSEPDQFEVLVQAGEIPPKPTLAWSVPSITNETSVDFTFSADSGSMVVPPDCRLEGPGQSGEFAPCESNTEQGYSDLSDGGYLFTLRVTNSIGNVNQRTRAWTVDTAPPAPVGAFRTRAGNGRVKLMWTKPVDLGYDHVLIARKRVGGSSWKKIGIRRDVSSLVDWTASNDVLYAYSIRSIDKAGNSSTASTARGRASKILSPQFDATLGGTPLIDWVSSRHATYYNMQLWRNGRKILSVWPLKSAYRLRSSWTFNGRQYTLGSDSYRVYVWPGFGLKSAARYGSLLGWSQFAVR
ncbi:MAG TPA: HYR domain-containing protein [Gaiellaceae bacterium]|nr:HYR domain-containing protein [Gaiellaceae bacterium]